MTLSKEKEAMVEELKKQLGVVSAACKNRGMSRETHYRWLREDIEYKEACMHMDEIVLDFAENKLFGLMDKGNPHAIMFYLKTKGKNRGYVERPENQFNLSSPEFTLTIVNPNDENKPSVETKQKTV